MKNMKKVTFFLFSCLGFANLPTHCDYGRDITTPVLTGAAIGGLAGGGRGAAYGALGGLAVGSMVASSRRRYDYDNYETQQARKARRKHRSIKQQLEDCMDENEALKEEISVLQKQLRKR